MDFCSKCTFFFVSALLRGAHLPWMHVRRRPVGPNRARPDVPSEEHVASADRGSHQHLSSRHADTPPEKVPISKSVTISIYLFETDG